MNKTKLILIGGGTLGALLLFGALFAWVGSSEPYGPDKELDLAMKLLERAVGTWRSHCAGHRRKGAIDRRPQAGLELRARRRRRPFYRRQSRFACLPQILWDASKFLEQSREGTFPLGYRGQGAYYLGYCYFNTYDWDKAIEDLAAAVDVWPQRRSDALAMIVEACLRAQPPKREEANQYLDKWNKIPGLSV